MTRSLHIDAPWRRHPGAQAVMAMLTDAGHQAYFVGGCVRNALLRVPVSDIDIATDAAPQTVTNLARNVGIKAIPTGIDHGTVTLVAHTVPYEVTTFRRDVATDGRHATVAFSTNIADDAARRDFTMNALYAAPDGTVHDPLGGIADLTARHVRFIGDPGARITEDYLRILRFFRFSAQYGEPGLGIDAEGLAACAEAADGLDRVSAERIGAEMAKLLAAADPAPAMAAMRACGVLIRLLPGAATGLLTVLVHVEQAAGLAPDWIRRMAALGAEDEPARLRLSRVNAARLDRLKRGLHSDATAAAFGYLYGEDDAMSILALRAASYERELLPADATSARFGARQSLPVAANDLMPGLEGPALGARLKELEQRWIASDFTLTKSSLLDG